MFAKIVAVVAGLSAVDAEDIPQFETIPQFGTVDGRIATAWYKLSRSKKQEKGVRAGLSKVRAGPSKEIDQEVELEVHATYGVKPYKMFQMIMICNFVVSRHIIVCLVCC